MMNSYQFRNLRGEIIAEVDLRSDEDAINMKDDVERHTHEFVFSILRVNYVSVREYDLSGDVVES